MFQRFLCGLSLFAVLGGGGWVIAQETPGSPDTVPPPQPVPEIVAQPPTANSATVGDPFEIFPTPSSMATDRMLQVNITDDGSGTSLRNNFTNFPEFGEGIVVVRNGVALKVGGYVKADLIKDFDAIDSTDSFDTTQILTGDVAQRDNARFHARQSRISFDTRWMVNGDRARAFIEADFFGEGAGGSDALRLRHAYGSYGRFVAGQTWTTFTDPSAVPQTLDFEGAVSNVNRRQGLVRWTEALPWDGFSVAVALEDPRVTIEAPTSVRGAARTESPDFISRLRYDGEYSEFQSALVLRELGFQPSGEPVINKTAWGLNFTGSALLTETDKTYFQITFGEGIGSYRGSPDVVATGPVSAAIVPIFGWMVGYKHAWNDWLTSNVTYSKLSVDDIAGQSPNNLAETRYLAINLIATPYERIFVGLEYLHGFREDVGGASGSADRLQSSFGFYLP